MQNAICAVQSVMKLLSEYKNSYKNNVQQNKKQFVDKSYPLKKQNNPNPDTLSFTGNPLEVPKSIFAKVSRKLYRSLAGNLRFYFSEKGFEECKNYVDEVIGDKYFSNIADEVIDSFRKDGGIKITLIGNLKVKTGKIIQCIKNGESLETVKEFDKKRQIVFDVIQAYREKDVDFRDDVAGNIKKIPKKVDSKWERTLNRAGTGLVSAIFTAIDFYHLTMLQKDNEEDSIKAGKKRFKQEATRTLISAGLTLITMGAFDIYIKNSIALNVMSIALSSLIAETVSRLANDTSIFPIDSKFAEKFDKKHSLSQVLKDNAGANTKNDAINFKSNIDESVFKEFLQTDGTFKSLNLLFENHSDIKNKKKNRVSYLKLLPLFITVASVTSLLSSAKTMDKIMSKIKSDGKFASSLTSGVNFITSALNKFGDTCNFLAHGKKVTIKGEEFNKFENRITQLQNNPNAEGLNCVLERYKKYLSDKNGEFEFQKDIKLWTPLAEGVTKIFRTIYSLFSSPATLIKSIVNKKSGPKDESSLILGKLYTMLKDANKKGISDDKIIEQLKEKTRNFNQTPESSELADLSRTFVTLISSYFFVNDYRNKVLTETKGKDGDAVSAETKQRIGHKISNFVFNGTIMNVGNSLFKTSLNSSLKAATAIALAEEVTNESLVRFSTRQPIVPRRSKKEIIDFEVEQMNLKGPLGAWSRFYKKLTGKKTSVEKEGIVLQNSNSVQNK